MERMLFLLVVLGVAGCQSLAQLPVFPAKAGHENSAGLQWLQLADELSNLSAAEAREQLEYQPAQDNPKDQFRFGLLNQQLDTLDGWIVARDRMRALQRQSELGEADRQLAAFFERYNQLRINQAERIARFDGQQQQLQAERDALAQQVEHLQKKIDALTNLENSMQKRRDRQDDGR